MCLLDIPASAIADPISASEVERQLGKAAIQTDHTAQLSYLWPALRQLASVPYDEPYHRDHAALVCRALAAGGAANDGRHRGGLGYRFRKATTVRLCVAWTPGGCTVRLNSTKRSALGSLVTAELTSR